MSAPLEQNTTKLHVLLELVNSLPGAGGVELPELTNEGLAVDLVEGRQLIGSSGEIVEGTLPEITSRTSLIMANGTPSKTTNWKDEDVIRVTVPYQVRDSVIRDGATICIDTEPSNFGNAYTDDVVSGKTFTSEEGLAITGTFSIDNELSAQDDLIAQIQAAVDSLPEAGNGGDSGTSGTFTLKIVVDTTYDDAIMTDQIGYIYYISHRQPINWEYDGAGQLTEIVLEDVDINTYIVIDFGITNVAAPSYFVLETSQNLYPVIDGVLYYGTEVNTVETISIRVY